MKTLTIPRVGKLMVEPNAPYGYPVRHSPKVWPWWKLWKLHWVRTNPNFKRVPGVHSFNVWLYTRNDARCTYVCLDTRKAVSA